MLVALLAACGKAPPPEEPVRAVKLVTVGETAYEAGHEYAAEVRARRWRRPPRSATWRRRI